MITLKSHQSGVLFKLLLPLVLGLASVIALPASRTLAGTEVPFHAQIMQSATFAPCPAGISGADACVTQTAVGNATHLGRTTKNSLIALTFVSPNCATFVEYTTFTAANGDTLTAVQTGTACFSSPTTVSATATYTVTGGTGRFSGATGSGTASTTESATSSGVFVGPATYDGVLSSPGSLH